MNDKPNVTVLMSVYNGERYLREAIESILSQTFTDFEFLIINDGSTDASRRIICTYDDRRIRLIDNQQNIGLVRSLNRGLTLAQGEYIARQDADDFSEPERLARQVAFMDANSHIVMSGTWYHEVDMDGTRGNRANLPTDCTELRWALLFFCPFVHTAVVMRKSFLLSEVGLYNEEYHYAMDHELWLRIAREGLVTNLPEYLVRYRISLYSMTATYSERTNEVVKLKTKSIGTLLGWNEDDHASNKVKYIRMFAVMYGGEIALNLPEVFQTTVTIWQLHQVFCETYQLSQVDTERHRAELRAWLSKRYIRIALGYVTGGQHSDARQLYREGLRLHPPTFLTTKSARLFYKLLLVQPVKTFWSFMLSR